MANVLIEESTLKDIGNAIRSKTGKTDLILPSNMATEISGITGGGDGGTTSEIYWTDDISFPSCEEMTMCPFAFEGKWYVILYIYNSTTKSYDPKIYLRNNDTYEYVCDYCGEAKYLSYQFGIVEYHGKVHFIGGDNTYHYTWDGKDGWETLSRLPYSAIADLIVFNDELYISCDSSRKIARYVESNDSWEIVGEKSSYGGLIRIFEYNSKLFTCDNTLKYVYEITSDGIVETDEISFTGFKINNNITVILNCGGKLFALSPTYNGCAMYQNGEWTVLQNTPTFYTGNRTFFVFNNKLYFLRMRGTADRSRVFYLKGI